MDTNGPPRDLSHDPQVERCAEQRASPPARRGASPPEPARAFGGLASAVRSSAGLVFAAALAFAPVAHADDDPPSPPAVIGETRVLADQFVRHQIAPPLPLADGSALLFQRDGPELVLWRIRPTAPEAERSVRQQRPDVRLVYDTPSGRSGEAAYASVETAAGHWLLGPTIALLRPDGAVLQRPAQRPRSGPRALALRDGSVLVLGGDSWSAPSDPRASVHVERVTLRPDGTIGIEPWPDIPAKIDGTGVWDGLHDFSAIALRDGRVMVTGGEYRATTWLWQPGAGAWQAVEGVDMRRERPTLIELADGRVWATGGSWLSGRDEMASSSSLWDPATRRWTPGPGLPVPMKRHVAAWSADHRTVILGAGEHAPLLAWTPGDARVQIAAAPALQRYLGALLPLPDGRVAVVSGLHANTYEEGWGRRSAGASLYEISTGASPDRVRARLWSQTLEGAVAAHGDQVVALGGRLLHTQTGSVDEDATRAVELQTLSTGRVRTLSPLPQPLRRAQAAWIDDHRVFVVGERAGDGPDGFLGVLDVATDRWQLLDAMPFDSRQLSDPKHGRAQLLGVDGKRAWLLAQDGSVSAIDVASGRLETLPDRERTRAGATGRLLADGRVVIAGGEIDAALLASRDEACSDDCEVRYIGWGPRAPARTYDVWDPRTHAWTTSPRAKGEGTHAVVLADGHVVMASLVAHAVVDPKNPSPGPDASSKAGADAPLPPVATLEVADAAAGGGWHTLRWPAGATVPDTFDGDQAGWQLRAAQGDDPLAAGALFLGLYVNGRPGMTWWWMRDAGAPGATWREIGVARPPWRFPAGMIPLGVKGADGRPRFAIGGDGGVVITGPVTTASTSTSTTQ